jgi:hypothetical protein
MKEKPMEGPKHTTAGSLVEQVANTEMRIAAARQERGSGYEAVAIGGRELKAWSPSTEAVFIIAEAAVEAALDPGRPEVVEEATAFLGRRALITREAVRDTEVLPLRQQTADAMSKHIAQAVAGMTVRNALAACQAFVRELCDEVSHLGARIRAGITQALSPTRLLDGIDEAIRSAEAGLATLASALRRLKAQAETEPTRIDQDLAASEEAAQEAEEHLRIIARETGRARIFGVDRALNQVIREVQVTIPRLSNERIAQMYLPLVREHMPAVERAIADRAERLEARIRMVREVQERLRIMRTEEAGRLGGRGRVQIVGAPATDAARDAAIEEVVKAVYPSLARELRDVLVWRGAPERILQELLGLVRERVSAEVPVPSIDDVLMSNADPEKVAIMLDHLVRDSEVPVALEPGADRSCLRELRCQVIRVPGGSRGAQAMIEHAGYRSDVFDWTGPRDSIQVIIWQAGLSIRSMRVFVGGQLAYREERADPAAPPVETFSDSVLRTLVRPPTAATPRARRRLACGNGNSHANGRRVQN